MTKEVTIKKSVARIIIFLGFIATVGFILACAPPPPPPRPLPPPLPTSHWGDNYFYNYEPAKKLSPASVKATVIVVNPFYKDAESTLIDPIYAKVGKGFSKSMGVDLDKIIIAKGMTSVGPYLTLEDVTYPDKKNADITLAPRVFLTTQTKYDEKWRYIVADRKNNLMGKGVLLAAGEGYRMEVEAKKKARRAQMTESGSGGEGEGGYDTRMEKNFEMKIGGWVAYVMQEPLSGEKMWVKKLELEERVVDGLEAYEALPIYETRYGGQYNNIPYQYLVRYDKGKILYDGRVEAVADALKEFYPIIMEKAWTYIDTDEILNLKEKTKEIRELKRY